MKSSILEPREDVVVEKLIKYLNKIPNCYAEKRHGGIFQKTGNPDITGCICGRRIEIEVKRPKEEAREKQDAILNRWGRCGSIVGVAHSLDELIQIFKNYDINI